MHIETILGKYMVTHNDETFDLYLWDLSIATEISAELTNIQNCDSEEYSNATCDELPLIKTFDYPSDARTIKLSGHKDEVHCVRFLLPLVVSGSADNTIRIWKIDQTYLNQYNESGEELAVCVRILTGNLTQIRRSISYLPNIVLEV